LDHLAILSKKGDWLAKILSGEKTIESRWYKHKKGPYGTIKAGDTIYFKESGEPVTAKARVEKALFFADLYPATIQKILDDYGKQICLQNYTLEAYKRTNYVTLVFLVDVKAIEPFKINKKGYGLMAAWITVDSIDRIRVN